MKISDLLIIYFSVGAPLAVYFYLQNRARANRKNIWSRTVFTFLFWIPAAVRFFRKLDLFQKSIFLNRADESLPRAELEKSLHRIQKRMEKTLRAGDGKISVFEFRETLQRYVGLTLASEIKDGKGGEEFFLAAHNKNPALAAECFERRNRQRLFFHRTSARKDFLQILARMSDTVSEERELGVLAVSFAKTLRDFEAVKILEKMFAAASPPNINQTPEKIMEKDLWNPQIQFRQQPPLSSISTFIQTTTQTASTTRSRKKE